MDKGLVNGRRTESWEDAWDVTQLQQWRRRLLFLRLSWALITLTLQAGRRVLDTTLALVLLALLLPQWALLLALPRVVGVTVYFRREYRVRGGWVPFTRLGLGSNHPGLNRWLRRSKYASTPEVLNVLRGEMTLRGPMAPCIAELNEFQRFQVRRKSFRPGVEFLPFAQTSFFAMRWHPRVDVQWLAVDHYRDLPRLCLKFVPLALKGQAEL